MGDNNNIIETLSDNPDFIPITSSNEIYIGTDMDLCLTDVLDEKANINHTHDNYVSSDKLNEKADVNHTHKWDDISNKPFGEINDWLPIYQNAETTINFYEWSSGVYGAAVTGDFNTLTIGNTYRVIWDGVEYLLTCNDFGTNSEGNQISSVGASYGDYSTYPFGIDSYMSDSGVCELDFHTNSTASTHTVDILEYVETVVTLDEKYIPSTIARTTEVDEALINKSDISHNHNDVYDTIGSAANALASANSYTNSKIDALVGEGASSTLDTIGEISSAIEDNQDAIDLLNSAIGNKANVADLNTHTNNAELHITDAERNAWNAKSNFSGSYNDLTDKPSIPSVSGFATTAYVDEAIEDKANVSHNHAISEIANLQSTLDSKAASNHNHNSVYDALGTAETKANNALNSAKEYADGIVNDEVTARDLAIATAKNSAISTASSDATTKVNNHNISTSAHSDIRTLISDLTTKLNNFLDIDDTTTDQLSEVIALINNNKGTLESLTTGKVNVSDIVDNLTTSSTSKVLSAKQGVAIKALIDELQTELDSHTHAITDVSGLQAALNGKANSSHGTHVSYSSTVPVMDGVASVGTASTVARSDHKHPVDTSRASQADLEALETIVDGKANNVHSHAISDIANLQTTLDAKTNQNAFSNVKIGSTTIAADTATDTITLVAGTNVTLTPDATNDKITISSTDTNTTYSAGTGISLSGTTFSNSGVRSISTGSSNGTISVNTNGTTTNVAVKGLGSAAYTTSSAYDAAGSANNALASAKTYADSVGATVKNDLLNGAGTAYDTLKELGDLIGNNVDAIEALETVAANKANTSDLNSHTSNKSNPHGVTLAQLGITATASELNKMDGVTATTTELNYVDGVTSNIQTQLDGKQSTITGGASTIASSNLTTNRALISNGSGKVAVSAVTSTELGYLDGVTSNVQTQLNGKAASSHTHNYAGSSSVGGAATSANKLNTNAGNSTTPVYFANGVPVACSTSFGNYMTKSNPTGTGYLSMNRKADTTVGSYSIALGQDCESSGAGSFAEGGFTVASGRYSHAEGYQSKATATYAHAEGVGTTASNMYAHAEGNTTTASGMGCHAEGCETTASGINTHAEGLGTQATSNGDHAEGGYTVASGVFSHAEGYYTKAASSYQHVQGQYNVIDDDNVYLHIVGNGESESARSNAHTLDRDGNAWYSGDVYVGGTSQSNGKKLVSLTTTKATISSLSSGWTVYGSNTTPTVRKFGNSVSLTGALKNSSALTLNTSHVQVFTIPEGYRPAQDLVVVCQGSGANRYVMQVTTSGAVNIGRYGTTSFTEVASGSWFPFHVTWIIE